MRKLRGGKERQWPNITGGPGALQELLTPAHSLPECIIHFLTKRKPAHIGDFGCGSGEMACRLGLLGYRVTSIDVSPDLIEVAHERARM